MRIRLCYSFYALLAVISLNAQPVSLNHAKPLNHGTDPLKNQVSIEIFGSGIKYSFGYERVLITRPQFNLASRIGAGYFPFNEQTFSVPLEITTFWGSNRGFIETGLGLTWCRYKTKQFHGASPLDSKEEYYSDVKESKLLPGLRFGYRYQKPDSRSSFRIALTFLFESDNGKISLFWPQVPIGLSYGYRF